MTHDILMCSSVIIIFIPGVHSAYTDVQWSPDNNSTQNIIQHINITKLYRNLQQFMNYKYLNVDSLTASTTLVAI